MRFVQTCFLQFQPTENFDLIAFLHQFCFRDDSSPAEIFPWTSASGVGKDVRFAVAGARDMIKSANLFLEELGYDPFSILDAIAETP